MVISPLVSGPGDLLMLAAPFLATLVLALGVWFLRRKRRQAARTPAESTLACVRCGYDLRGQSLPRCPECGTLRGFAVPMEGLGLTEAELQAYAGAKAKRSGERVDAAARSARHAAHDAPPAAPD